MPQRQDESEGSKASAFEVGLKYAELLGTKEPRKYVVGSLENPQSMEKIYFESPVSI